MNARRIRETVMLGEYSTPQVAPVITEDGKFITLERSEKRSTQRQVARKNFGVASKVKAIVGVGTETIKTLEPAFDLAFIDADTINSM